MVATTRDRGRPDFEHAVGATIGLYEGVRS